MRFHLVSYLAGAATVIAVVLLVGVFWQASAEDWLVGSVSSYHLKRAGQNEANWGGGIERSIGERWRAVAGGYNNSSGDASFYAGAVYLHTTIGGARLGTLGAVITGYEREPCLLLAPTLSIEGRRLGANLIFIPAAGGVLGLQVKMRTD